MEVDDRRVLTNKEYNSMAKLLRVLSRKVSRNGRQVVPFVKFGPKHQDETGDPKDKNKNNKGLFFIVSKLRGM